MKLWIPVVPRPKQRPRMTRSGHVYTPKDTKDIENAIGGEFAAQFPDHEPWAEPLDVRIAYEKDGFHVELEPITNPNKANLRGDIDNYVKATLDALNKIAYTDDRWVYRLRARKD